MEDVHLVQVGILYHLVKDGILSLGLRSSGDRLALQKDSPCTFTLVNEDTLSVDATLAVSISIEGQTSTSPSVSLGLPSCNVFHQVKVVHSLLLSGHLTTQVTLI